jgi:hypothetical protein
MQFWKHAVLHTNGHMSVDKTSYWGEDVTKLWKSAQRYWNTGRLYQLVREASTVPYDQRSYVQRWVVRTATFDGTLPIRTLSKEPDIEDEATLAFAVPYLRVDMHGQLFAEDITVWMFLKMTQPEERERTVEWFWFTACRLFTKRGEYEEILGGLKLHGNTDDRVYAPFRFIHVGEWTTSHLAQHFYYCGLRSEQANTLFYEFAMHWMENLPVQPRSPDWSRVPHPRQLTLRKKVRRAFKPKPLVIQWGQGYPETTEVSLPYDDPSTTDQQPIVFGGGSTLQPEDSMPIDEAGEPLPDLNNDRSRM